MPEKNLKILTVSLTGRDKWKAYASYNGHTLYILKMEQITGIWGTWKKPLIDEINQRLTEGYAVLVEEKTRHISNYATPFDFEDTHQFEEQINLYVALKFYFQMLRDGATPQNSNIVIKPEYQRFYIQESLAEIDRDDKGRMKFNIAWDALNGGHRCVLMCVMAAHSEPVSERFLTDVFGEFAKPQIPEHLRSLYAVLRLRGHFGEDLPQDADLTHADMKRLDHELKNANHPRIF